MAQRAALLTKNKPEAPDQVMTWTAQELVRKIAKPDRPQTALSPRFKRSLHKLMEAKP